jgi:hypothetical protein
MYNSLLITPVRAQRVHWYQLNVKALPCRELKFTANSPSPLKWTENNSESHLEMTLAVRQGFEPLPE